MSTRRELLGEDGIVAAANAIGNTIMKLDKGKLVLPQGQGYTKPHILYAHGDYVLLTLAESNSGFNRLSGNHQRYVNEFYSLVPELASTSAFFSNDGRTFSNFLKTWGSVCRDSSCLSEPFGCLAIEDTNGLEGIFLNEWCKRRPSQEMVVICNGMANLDLSNTVRATFLLARIIWRRSSNGLTCSLIWVCYVKAEAKVNEPGFARCLATWDELLGEDGIVVAANLHVMVAGSPKLEFYYETDFGWGKPKKIEEISIDKMRAISFTESRDVKGGIEVGLALTKAKMDAFTMFFSESLDLHE
ncbi:malonyl-CoA:anthocyanidin 5-O-glucoside-6''-O-malonyltransferase [Citrus clementina]|uniref:malonyl-CoA:anthocyanidin 5-O-glucoside-6''-O-malonyltransferase n=1 Tax=Citrus clementina TaxID=85681 RepID=UPI000CECFB66|nr:malonyl-CoA:anthocyanidin 5-O-glucoside-6''-O-malonyltransferase [Citrus x clementina]